MGSSGDTPHSKCTYTCMYTLGSKQKNVPVTHEVTALEVPMFLFFSLCMARTYLPSP